MNSDALASSDSKDFVIGTARRLRSSCETRIALEGALARRERRAARRKPVLASALALGAAAVVVPIPYRQEVGWDATFRSPAGQVVTVPLAAPNAGEARRLATKLALAEHAEVNVAPRTELVWGSVYAIARAKLFRVDVDLKGKSDAEAEAEIRRQLTEQGWHAGDVRVNRGDGTTTVELGAVDGDGRQIRMVRKDVGGGSERIELRPEPIDDMREPGMTDAQLREKILAQLRARGLDGEVTVEGDRVRIQVQRSKPE